MDHFRGSKWTIFAGITCTFSQIAPWSSCCGLTIALQCGCTHVRGSLPYMFVERDQRDAVFTCVAFLLLCASMWHSVDVEIVESFGNACQLLRKRLQQRPVEPFPELQELGSGF